VVTDRHLPSPANNPEWSTARRWDEALLDAVAGRFPTAGSCPEPVPYLGRDGTPGLPDPVARGYLVTEKHTGGDVEAARDEAISYAAYRVLSERYIKSVGGAESLSAFADVMDALCYPVDVTTTEGDSPAAVGNRIAAAVIAYGNRRLNRQVATRDRHTPVNGPLIVASPGRR
jgi:hypothetical protein